MDSKARKRLTLRYTRKRNSFLLYAAALAVVCFSMGMILPSASAFGPYKWLVLLGLLALFFVIAVKAVDKFWPAYYDYMRLRSVA
ncbi:hypothetical protein Xoosp14_54 [Xanthomonas phage Xoo-sp14]|nr:hypothetical protein Xoosp14_54 [Xanthomonas phage Xoo-sp14]